MPIILVSLTSVHGLFSGILNKFKYDQFDQFDQAQRKGFSKLYLIFPNFLNKKDQEDF